MKKFGFSKGKSSGDDDDSSVRSALFGSRGKSSPAASSNPYAQPQKVDPYAQKSQADRYGGRPSEATPPPPYNNGGYGGMNNDPYSGGGSSESSSNQGGSNRYGPSAGGSGGYGYGEDRYGAQSGAGGSGRYGGSGGTGNDRYASQSGSRYGPSGYGGLGRTNSHDTTTTEDNREALFGGAKERLQKQQQQQLPPENGQPGGGYAAESGYGGGPGTYGGTGQSQGYGAYQDRELTAEEQEEEDVQATKQQIRFIKQEDVNSTRRALQLAAQAEETGRNTLARLGAQGERIHNTEKSLDLAANHNRIAEEKAKELKRLNKSMFAVHVNNPFTAADRRRQRDEDIINKHRSEREQRETTRAAAFDTQVRNDLTWRELRREEQSEKMRLKNRNNLADRSKYQFEADSEDDEMENEIEKNLDHLSIAAGNLNRIARATGREVDEQNDHIDRIINKSDKVDDQIAMNRARLDRIH